ncbi:hypothetical protein HDU91_002622, partial [Kappamyces sp. JEL0680]
MSLSKQSKSILNECAIHWNVSKDFKEAAIFDAIVKKYASGSLGLNEVFPAFKLARKQSAAMALLRKTDRELLLSSFVKLRVSLSTQMQQFLGMVHLQRLTPDDCSSVLRLVVFMLVEMNGDPLCNQSPAIPHRSTEDLEEDVADEIRLSTRDRLDYIQNKINQAFPATDQVVLRMSKVVQTLSADIKKYKAYYPMEIIDRLLVYRVAGNEYTLVANSLCQQLQTVDPDTPMLQILELYDHFRDYYDLCIEVGVTHTLIPVIESYFLPMIDTWLARTDSKWLEWIQRAYYLDNFEPIVSPKNLNSTSVLDVFTVFQSALSFVSKFRFKDKMKKEQLKRNFITVTHKILVSYCKLLFQDFEGLENHSTASAFLFSPAHVVKFNNIMFAQELMEKLVAQLHGMDESHLPGIISPAALQSDPVSNLTT